MENAAQEGAWTYFLTKYNECVNNKIALSQPAPIINAPIIKTESVNKPAEILKTSCTSGYTLSKDGKSCVKVENINNNANANNVNQNNAVISPMENINKEATMQIASSDPIQPAPAAPVAKKEGIALTLFNFFKGIFNKLFSFWR